jgi:hypothetical protein
LNANFKPAALSLRYFFITLQYSAVSLQKECGVKISVFNDLSAYFLKLGILYDILRNKFHIFCEENYLLRE